MSRRPRAAWAWGLAALLALRGAPARAGDVVSLNLCTDSYVLLLAPGRIAALSPLARDPALSVYAAAASAYPVLRPDAEAVLARRPALVLAGRFGAQAAIAALRRHGLALVQIDEPADFAGVAAVLRSLARALGVAARGEALARDMEAALARPAPPRGTAILYEARGFTAGDASFGGAVLRQAGWRNLGTGAALSIEALVARPPDLLVTEQAPAYPSLATDLPRHPALRAMRTRSLPPALLACAGPWSVRAVRVLAAP